MKKRVKLKRKTISLIVKNLIVLVALAAVALAAVFSWFTDHPEVDSSGVTGSVEVDESLEYFIVSPEFTDSTHKDHNNQPINAYQAINLQLQDNAAWNADPNNSGETRKIAQWRTGEVSLDPDLNPELGFLSELAFCDITSDGVTFKVPKLIQHEHIAYVDTTAAFSNAVPNRDYLSFDIYFRCPVSCTVVMKNASTISPTGTPANTKEGRKYAAVGAARLSAVPDNNNQSANFIWIPAPRMWFDGRTEEGVLHTNLSDLDLAAYKLDGKGGNVTSDGATISLTGEDTVDHAYYSESNNSRSREIMRQSDESTKVRPSLDVDYQLPDDESLVTLQSIEGMNDEYKYGHIRINLWIEGEDAEARLDMTDKNTPSFHFNLVFDAVASQQSNTP